MDLSLLITIGIIFIATFIGSALRSLSKDRCLKDFDGFHIMVERKDGHVVWGVMRLQPTGFELEYREDVLGDRVRAKTSYVVYKSEYGNIQAIYRYADDLTPENRAKRDRSYQKAFHPGFFRYVVRRIRNFANTAVDSISQVFNLLIGQSKVVAGQAVTAQGQKELGGLTKNILGYVGTSFDPLLETFIGAQVVLELTSDGKVEEYVGVFKDYSSDHIEILDVYFPQSLTLKLKRGAASQEGQTTSESVAVEAKRGEIQAEIDGVMLVVRNRTAYPLFLAAISVDDKEIPIDKTIDAKGLWRYEFDDQPRSLGINVRTVHKLDMILPRSHSLIRHRGERYQASDAVSVSIDIDLTPDRGDDARRVRFGRAAASGAAEHTPDFQALLAKQADADEAVQRLSRVLAAYEQASEGEASGE
jgi:hypothetical protein